MKYTIMGFSQEKTLAYGLTLDDLCILQYIMDAQASPKMYKHLDEATNTSYAWISHKKLLEDLPIINITEGTLRNKLAELRKKELIISITIANTKLNGSKTFYAITDKVYDLIYQQKKDINKTSEEDDRCHSEMTSRCHFKMTSDSPINTDISSKLDIQDIGGDNPNGLSDFANRRGELNNSYLDSQDTKTHNNNTFSKYECIREKCKKEIGAYTTDSKLQESLIKFLDMRIEKWKTSPKATLTLQSFKGYLKKLDTLDFKLEVVNQSTRNEWNTFYEVKPIYGKPKAYNAGVKSVAYTEQEKEEIEKWRKDNNVPSF